SQAATMGPHHRRARRPGQVCPLRHRQAWRRCYDRRAAMPFIPPMLATRLEDPRRLADPRYSAEPKLDGQRAQLHVRDHRTVHAFSRPGRDLITLPGLAWLRDLRWPVASAVLESCQGRGQPRRLRDRVALSVAAVPAGRGLPTPAVDVA